MDKYFTLESISAIITILSFAFGIWQYSQNRKIKRIITLEAVELHNNIAMALGAIQEAKTEIGNREISNFEVGRAEGLSQAVLHESAKLYCNLAGTKVEDIDRLIKAGQLNEDYKDLYYSFSSNKRWRFNRKSNLK